jgi:hypothetical protein
MTTTLAALEIQRRQVRSQSSQLAALFVLSLLFPARLAYGAPVPAITDGSYDDTPTITSPITSAITSTPTTTIASVWAPPPQFTDMSSFALTSFAAGQNNVAVLEGSPSTVNTNSLDPNVDTDADADADGTNQQLFSWGGSPSQSSHWESTANSVQVFYPGGSINPGNYPQGGAQFYGHPLDLSHAKNATLEYSVYFPIDFDFVKGGKLPGLYGGHGGCTGGSASPE